MPLGLTSANHDLSHLLGSPVDTEVREHLRRLDLARDVASEVARLGAPSARATAEHRDREALSTALVHGDPDPGHPAVDALDEALTSARRRSDALALAVDQFYAAVLDAVADAAPEWLQDLARDQAAARARVGAAVTALAAALGEVDSLAAAYRLVSVLGSGEDLTFRDLKAPPAPTLNVDRWAVAQDGDVAAVPVGLALAALAGYGG